MLDMSNKSPLTVWSCLRLVRARLTLPDRACASRRDCGLAVHHHSRDSRKRQKLCEWDIVMGDQLKQEPKFVEALMRCGEKSGLHERLERYIHLMRGLSRARLAMLTGANRYRLFAREAASIPNLSCWQELLNLFGGELSWPWEPVVSPHCASRSSAFGDGLLARFQNCRVPGITNQILSPESIRLFTAYAGSHRLPVSPQ